MRILFFMSLAIFILSACATSPEKRLPGVVPTDLPPHTKTATNLSSNTIRPLPTQALTPIFEVTSSPNLLGTIRLRQYSYKIVHDYDFDFCISDPYVCPSRYSALLSDVYTWMYVQSELLTWLQFDLDGDYQIKSPNNKDENCDVLQNDESMTIGIMCKAIGEFTLELDLLSNDQIYPLILHIISVPDLRPTPALIIPPGLRLQEHELLQHPDVEPLTFKPGTGIFSDVFEKSNAEWGQPTSGKKFVHLQNGQQIQAEETSQATGQPDPSHVINIAVLQNETKILEIQTPVSPIPALRGLWAIGNDWFAEIAAPQNDSFRSLAKGDIFKNGMSLNEMDAYSESFGFQLLGGKSFYFFERFGRVGISYGGQEIPLGYERVIHYECCSAGELNPRTFENMIGFFAVRGDKWYYVEISISR